MILLILDAINRLTRQRASPILVSLDGRSGTGKSTLAIALAQEVSATLVPNDDFFAAEITSAAWAVRSALGTASLGVNCAVRRWSRCSVATRRPSTLLILASARDPMVHMASQPRLSGASQHRLFFSTALTRRGRNWRISLICGS